MSEWQPIETAPRETELLAFWEASRVYGIACYYDDDDEWRITEDMSTVSAPTHWMPLPEPPPKPKEPEK